MPTSQELFERYIYAGLTKNAELQSSLFAADGLYEVPFAAPGGVYPRRVQGREEIRTFFTELHARGNTSGTPTDVRYVPHRTEDPAVFIAETDAVVDDAPMSLVHIVRSADGEITHLRDYFVLTP
ncbi:nuclear transport factor 2 family protein [Cryptosporangium sp. NPDC051539]|uniref:nuclear transport factor 2 family protein n=1 Tax=Cryptosporangium sp. NPDC051539 TaxID=3363962 RepID=UPI0037ADF60D